MKLPPLYSTHAVAAGLIAALALAVGGWYLYSGGVALGGEAERTVRAVGKHMYLPEGEEPTVASITDLEPLQGQPFFAKAQIGHKVIIYTKARRVILYDPKGDRIVEVAPLNIEPSPE